MDDKSDNKKELMDKESDPLIRAIIDAGDRWCEREYKSHGPDTDSSSVYFSVLSKEDEPAYVCLGGNVIRLSMSLTACADRYPFFADLLMRTVASLIYMGDISERELAALVKELRSDDFSSSSDKPQTIVS